VRTLDVLATAGGSLRTNRLRTGLSLLGVAIGVAAVIVLTGLGEGGRRFVRGEFEFIGTDVMSILPGKVETSGAVPGFGGVPNDLTIADAKALARALPDVERIAPVALGNDTIARGNRSRQVLVFGSTPDLLQVRRLALRGGTFLPEGPWERGAAVVVIGTKVAAELFPGQNPLGGVVRIGGWRMRVVGVLAHQGVHFGIDLDETVIVPVATAMQMFDLSSLFRITLQARPDADMAALQRRSAAVLVERHGEEDFTITTPDAILSSLESILTLLTLVLVGIGAISLTVAGVGIMNVMLVAVAERTPEIGLFKAVGATPRQVLVLFLVEAAMISGIGGALGILLGWGILFGASFALASIPSVPVGWVLAATAALSVGVGVTTGLWPAVRALRVDPVQALSGRPR
jgi:putative ABC transport system permease protein